jgi:AraC-like DNA-binding protein
MSLPLFRWPARIVPVIQVAGRFPLDDRHFAYTYRAATHALHLYDYAGTMRFGRRQVGLQPGDITLSTAGVGTQYDLPQPGHHWCIHFQTAPARGETVAFPVHLHAGAQRRHLSDRLAEISQLHNQTSPARAAVLFQDLLLWLAARQPPARRSDAALDRLLALLDERFAEPWTVPQLAETVGMTQDHLARCFRQRMGMTIPRYLLKRRIAHARQLLAITDLPVNRIAARVGMPDPQHFNKQFRLLTGLSPSVARLGEKNSSPRVR